jgi:hypothetical protein
MLARFDCAESLAPWVENYWILQWELTPGTTYRSSTLPHPACTVSVEHGHLREGVEGIGGPVVVTGVLTHRFDVTLQASGWVLGVKFRPGGFASLTGTSVRHLRDVAVAAPTALPLATIDALAELGSHPRTSAEQWPTPPSTVADGHQSPTTPPSLTSFP